MQQIVRVPALASDHSGAHGLTYAWANSRDVFAFAAVFSVRWCPLGVACVADCGQGGNTWAL